MKLIPLDRDGQFAIVDDCDFMDLGQYKWRLNRDGYANRMVYCSANKSKGTTLLMHRAIMRADKGQEIDHINGNRLDNRRENLRFCTRPQNMRNSSGQKQNKAGYKGVEKVGNYFRALIVIGYTKTRLGMFDTAEAAARAYDKAAFEASPDFSKLNFRDRIWTMEELAPFRREQKAASGLKGVSRRGKGWTAVVHFNNTKKRLGQFASAEEAANAINQFNP